MSTDPVELFIVGMFALVLGMLLLVLGMLLGDVQTYIDCSRYGQSKMVAAGQITCEVVKK